VAEDERRDWPALRVDDWTATRETLHLWTQIVGKIRMAQAPMVNHWWHVPLYVSARGLTTSPMPYGTRAFEIEFDFCAQRLEVRTSDAMEASFALEPQSVADFYARTMAALEGLGIRVRISTMPVELPGEVIPFDQDTVHASYDADRAQLFWRQLVQADRVLTAFRSRFIGKASPVHVFWGGLDMAVTRFSGRPAPRHPGGFPNVGDWVMHEAYSHEVSSAGFWPGGGEEGAFYSYAYPEPDGFAGAPVGPEGAAYNPDFGQFLLPYETVRTAPDPDAAALEFLQTTYEAAAGLAGWDRAALER
jgi:hypothetical protein